MNYTEKIRPCFLLLGMGIAVLMVGCGSGKSAQCKLILNTIQQNQSQRVLGTQDKAATLKNAELSEQLANQISALEIKDNKLQESKQQLAEAYRAEAVSSRAKAELINEEGTIRITVGDTAQESAYKKIQADEMRANNNIQLATQQLMSYCAR